MKTVLKLAPNRFLKINETWKQKLKEVRHSCLLYIDLNNRSDLERTKPQKDTEDEDLQRMSRKSLMGTQWFLCQDESPIMTPETPASLVWTARKAASVLAQESASHMWKPETPMCSKECQSFACSILLYPRTSIFSLLLKYLKMYAKSQILL